METAGELPASTFAVLARLRNALRGQALRQDLIAFSFVLPTVIGLLGFYLLPVIASFALGFMRWSALRPPTWVGLANYAYLMDSRVFWRALVNTVQYTVVVVVASTVLGLAAALVLNRPTRAAQVYQSAYFLPYTPSMVAIGIIWLWVLDPRFGVLNYLIESLGFPALQWFHSSAWALPTLMLISIWRTVGYNMLFYLAALQSLPRELLEAARVDGATYLQLLRRIIVPLVSPTTFFVLIIGIINSFQVFDLTYVSTQGGPGYATQTLAYYSYQLGIEFRQFGLSSAVGYLLFVLIVVFTVSIFRTESLWVHYR